jgi:hypothetical protein
MNTKLMITACVGYILVCSCRSPDKNPPANTRQNSAATKTIQKPTFIDSIMSKTDISRAQLKRHLLDTGYFSNYTHFAGDTVYYPNSDYRIVILSMGYRGVCLEKYLLVYRKNSLKNTACMRVETDCDIDYGIYYSKLDYKIFNNTQFYTRDAWYEVYQVPKLKITVTDQFYKINADGKIDSLKQKPPGLILPKFIPMDVTDDGE